MYFVEVGHGIVSLGKLDDLADRTNVTIHGVDRFECYQLWAGWVGSFQQAFKVSDVIVFEDMTLGAAVTNAFNH